MQFTSLFTKLDTFLIIVVLNFGLFYPHIINIYIKLISILISIIYVNYPIFESRNKETLIVVRHVASQDILLTECVIKPTTFSWCMWILLSIMISIILSAYCTINSEYYPLGYAITLHMTLFENIFLIGLWKHFNSNHYN